MNTILKTILEVTIYSSVMIVALLAMKAIWRRKIRSSVLSLLWILVLARLLMPITFETTVHIDSIFPQKIQSIDAIGAQTYDTATYNPMHIENTTEYSPNLENDNTNVSTDTDNFQNVGKEITLFEQILIKFKSIEIWTYILILWIAGASFFLLKTIADYIDFSRRVRASKRVNSRFLDNALVECKAALGISEKLAIMQCRYVSTPVTFGFRKPIVLLPVGFVSQISEAKLKMIILHELCHIKRKDILKNCIWLFAKTIHWFNPLVWIAYKFYLDDLELACDEMVIKNISDIDSFEYSQSLLDVIRLSKKKVIAPAALAFCEEKSKLRKRVENMIQPQKKLKLAGFTSLLLAIIMIVGCFTTACQPTIDNAVDYSALNDAQPSIENTETTTIEPTEQPIVPEEIFTRYKAPETYEKIYEQDSSKIIISAQVEVPEVEKFYSVKLERQELTQDLADMFLDYFIGESPMYMRISEGEKASTLENELANWKQVKENAENNWDEVKNKDPYQGNGGQQGAIEYAEGVIERLEEQLKTAPDVYGYEPMSRQIALPRDDGGKDIPEDATEEEIAAAKAEDERVASLQSSVLELLGYAKVEESYIEDKMAYLYLHGDVGKSATLYYDNSNSAAENGYYIGREQEEELSKEITITLEEAVAIAQEAMLDLGLSETWLQDYYYNAVVKDGELSPCYVLTFKKRIHGMPTILLANGLTMQNRLTDVQPTDTIQIIVDESGVLKFSWSEIMRETEILHEFTDIMSFDEITTIFDEETSSIFSKTGNKEVVIDKITLSMLPIMVEGEIITVPVWDFRGYSYDPNDIEQKNKVISWNVSNTSFLTINAIDGTIIDR